MNIAILQKKKAFLDQHRDSLPEAAMTNYAENFSIEYTHNSTAIEGNTLSLMETKLLLDDQLSVGGKQLREIYEVSTIIRRSNMSGAVLPKAPRLMKKSLRIFMPS